MNRKTLHYFRVGESKMRYFFLAVKHSQNFLTIFCHIFFSPHN